MAASIVTEATSGRAEAAPEPIVLITQIVNRWAIARDSGDWDALLQTWHDDGQMVSTWQQSDARAFVEGCRSAWERGVDVLHSLCGTAVDVSGDRAIAQTKMSISQRVSLGDAAIDVVCFGRFYDFFEWRGGRWGIVLRQPIYERDRIDPLHPATPLALDPELLASFPSGYRHLAYFQTLAGMTVKRDLPGTRGPEIEHLYTAGQNWLNGGALADAFA